PGRVASWLGAEAPAAPIIAFGRGQAFDGVSRAGFEAVALSFDEAWFMELAERIGLRMPAQALAPGAVRTPGLPGASRRVAARAERMLSRPGPAPARADKEALAFDLIRSLGAPDEGPDALAPGLRGRALRRALEAMDADLDAELTVADVCALSGASWRTLNRAFLERFGMGPKAYLRGLRLSRARSDLIAADPQVKVADVANRWGFWHMGQFAADYRKLFGALPSEHARR
ncbi:MAG: helix-turn-helix transcriptional regulator, partial [Pseudomonadota bacterium]